MRAQAEEADPLEFLKVSQGFELLRLAVLQTQTRQYNVDTEITVSDSLQIKYHSSNNNMKQANYEETKGQPADIAKDANASKKRNVIESKSSFRNRLFK